MLRKKVMKCLIHIAPNPFNRQLVRQDTALTASGFRKKWDLG
jgi:hypothetical protein